MKGDTPFFLQVAMGLGVVLSLVALYFILAATLAFRAGRVEDTRFLFQLVFCSAWVAGGGGLTRWAWNANTTSYRRGRR